MRVVIDTNVLISGTFWTGKPKQLLNKARRREITFLTSVALLDEMREVLTRQDKPFKLSHEDAETIVLTWRELAEVVSTHTEVSICRDEGDNRVLECAADGQADFIVTGDQHLLELGNFHGIRIMPVVDFLNQFKPVA